jgi:hypothetical protein
MLGCQFTLTDNPEKYLNASNPVICYAKEYTGKGIHIIPHGLLSEKGVHTLEPEVSHWEELPVFFRTSEKEIPFDLFAASFYLLSRYEEYLEKSTDKHGRYPMEKSLAFRYGFLEQPVADQWAIKLKKILHDKYPEIKFNTPAFQFIPTVDVDNVFAYRHKGLLVNGFQLLREVFTGKFRKAKYRLNVILRNEEDPFFNLKRITSLHRECGTLPIFFFHCGGYGKYDKKTFFPSFTYRSDRWQISRDFIVGLHPSYHAAFSPFRFWLERRILERSMLDKSVLHNRFHYLRFRIPESYRMLSLKGFEHDWSMGYSTRPGFRAGTSFPFYFYNLISDKTYRLTIHPFAVMDKTLKKDLNLNDEQSRQYILNLARRVKAVNGTFVTIFHNENLTDAFDWKGWKKMYCSLLEELRAEVIGKVS